MTAKTQEKIGFILGIIIVLSFYFLIGFCAKSCRTQMDNKKDVELQYGLSHPSKYSVTYTDGSSDTILVWNTNGTDEFSIYDNGGTFKDGNVVYIDYIPYSQYRSCPNISNEVRIYNILKYKKLK